jgi:hypothetical protein
LLAFHTRPASFAERYRDRRIAAQNTKPAGKEPNALNPPGMKSLTIKEITPHAMKKLPNPQVKHVKNRIRILTIFTPSILTKYRIRS